MNVLLVEDSRVLREQIRDIVNGIDGAVLVAETGDETDAIGILGRLAVDVAVIDLRLNSGSGMSVIKHINAVYPATVVIVLTNYAQQEYRERCMAIGAHHFFDKSKDLGAFMNLLGNMSKVAAGAEPAPACELSQNLSGSTP